MSTSRKKPERQRKKGASRQELTPAEELGIIGKNLGFAAAEAYKLLRANIQFALPDEKKCRIVGVTSALGGEGKSTTALNLSYMLAESEKKVLLLEADMRLPTAARRMKLKGKPGLSDLLAGLNSYEEIIQDSKVHEGLKVVVCGSIPPNPSELLGTERMEKAMEEFSRDFDFIVLDLPPVNAVSDALVASRLADGILVVVRQDYASRGEVADTVRRLQYAGAKVLGFVLTRSDTLAKGGKYKKYGKYRRYGYGYGYGQGQGQGDGE